MWRPKQRCATSPRSSKGRSGTIMADENGFEYQGVFYPWHVTTTGKDLLLIDRISGLPLKEFFAIVEDNYDMARAPVTLALIATSMRNRHPDRSLERILRTVMELDMESDEFEVIGGDDEEAGDGPPAVAAEGGPSDQSHGTSNGSAGATSETSSETSGSFGSRGSDTGSPDTPATA
jgi:hypothetical protein